MRDFKIGAVVVRYNISSQELMKNINTYSDYVDKIVIVDNSEPDYIYDTVLSDSSKIKIISLNNNYGIAHALNVGIEYLIQEKIDFALTMDQDSAFENNIILEFKKHINTNTIIYSPKYKIERKRYKQNKKDIEYVYWTMTSGNLLNLEYYKLVGNFKEEYFIDAVDYEYCIRARKKGYKILQCNNAILNHNPGITKEKKILVWNYKYGYMSPNRMYYQVRNLMDIYKKYNSYRALMIIVIKFLKILLLFDDKKKFLKNFNKAIVDCNENKFGKLMEN